MRGLTNRQPSVLSWTVTSPRGNASRALGITSGARDIDSTPPAIDQVGLADGDRAHAVDDRLQARAAQPVHGRARHASTGRPASSRLMRATLRLSSPAWLAQPKNTSSMPAGSAPARRTTSRDHDRAQIVGPHLGQRAAEPPDRRPHRVDDEHVPQ